MPSLSRKERKRKETPAIKITQDNFSNLTTLDVAKPVTEDDESVAKLIDKADVHDVKDDDGTSDVRAQHQLEEVLFQEEHKGLVENNDPSEDADRAADSQGSLEDIFTSTPPVNSDDDVLEVTPDPPSKKKVKRRKTHTNECPQNPSRKLVFKGSKTEGKKAFQKGSRKMKRKLGSRKEFQNRDIPQQGVWVQCDNFKCRKWRFLSSVSDPAKVDQNWTCAMHPDDTYNSCDKPEEDYTDLEFIHNQFTEGSIVWAKMQGYPWWPAMVESDPDTGYFMEHEGVETEVTSYHCVFLDKAVSRSWVPAIFVKTFKADGNPPGSLILKKRDYSKQVMPAKERALDALNLPLKERIEKYGFGKTFKGVWKEKKSREPRVHYPDSSHQEETSEVDADDVLGELLSSEDMEELINETEGLLTKAEEAVQEMSSGENILDKATNEEKKIKPSRKRKPSKCEEESTVKRKKHKKKKGKHEKSRKDKHVEKKKRKRPLTVSALKDNVRSDDEEKLQVDKNLSFKTEVKENEVVLNVEKKMGGENEMEVMKEEEVQESAEVGEKEMKGGNDGESCDEARDAGDEEGDKASGNEPQGCFQGNKMQVEEETEGMPVLSQENIGDDGNANEVKVDGDCEVGGKDSHDGDEGSKDGKVKGNKDGKTTKAEREEKRKHREVKRQLDFEEKERKRKEKEMKKLKKEKEKQEKEEKKKKKEMKKQQALEEKEKKKKARLEKSEKTEKKAKKIKKLPEANKDTAKDSSENIVKGTGDIKESSDAKMKKAKFSVPKGKPRAFVPPGEKQKTASATEQGEEVTSPSQKSVEGNVDKDMSKGTSDGAEPLNATSVSTGEGSKSKEVNTASQKPFSIKNEKLKDSGMPQKLKKKKFSVKRKELSSDNATKAECGEKGLQSAPNSLPITTAKDSESQGCKVSDRLDSDKEKLLISNKHSVENAANDSTVPIECSVLEKKCSDGSEELSRDKEEFEDKRNCKVENDYSLNQTKQNQEVNSYEDEDVLDLEWSVAPEMAGKKSLVTSVTDEDSDPFETVEE